MLGEMAAAVVLERVHEIRPGQIQLVDTAIACEAYDLIRPSPQMPALSHVAHQLLTNRQIDVLHPHATGTVDHDPRELTAIARHLGGRHTDVYACKGAIGHGLGAAGLASLVIACLCTKSDGRPSMPWLKHPIDVLENQLHLSSQPLHRSVISQAVFAAGFGGHVAGAVIKRRETEDSAYECP